MLTNQYLCTTSTPLTQSLLSRLISFHLELLSQYHFFPLSALFSSIASNFHSYRFSLLRPLVLSLSPLPADWPLVLGLEMPLRPEQKPTIHSLLSLNDESLRYNVLKLLLTTGMPLIKHNMYVWFHLAWCSVAHSVLIDAMLNGNAQ